MIAASGLLAHLPDGLREELLQEYNKIVKNFREGRWEPAELDGGKLCEIVYSIISGVIGGKYPAKAFKPKVFLEACKELEAADGSKFPRSIRVQIPRILVALYEVRNNRGVGHVGGDVSPNHMDATLVLSMSKWLLSELVRFFHELSPEQATDAIDALQERDIPVVWEVEGKKRVLDTNMNKTDQTLLLLYQSFEGLGEEQLFSWLEHSNKSTFRRDILKKQHARRLLEYDNKKATARISPSGAKYVEENILTRKH